MGEKSTVDTQTPQKTRARGNFYSTIVEAIHRLGTGETPRSRAQLAILRRGAGKEPGKDPLAWSTMLESVLPEFEFSGRGDQPSHDEYAAFYALTFFALHQRSHTQRMHVEKQSLGSAVAKIKPGTGSMSIESIKRRLDALMAAQTQKAKLYHLRSLINLLSTNDIPLDYGMLASDLWSLQDSRRDGVILRWGRDYSRTLWIKSADPSESAKTNS